MMSPPTSTEVYILMRNACGIPHTSALSEWIWVENGDQLTRWTTSSQFTTNTIRKYQQSLTKGYGIGYLRSFGTWKKEKTCTQATERDTILRRGTGDLQNRTSKPSQKARADEMSISISYGTMMQLRSRKSERKKRSCITLNSLNRVFFAYNRDKGRCRVCGTILTPQETHTYI